MFQNLTPRRLPSLTGLRAFEAMARLGSATRAGQELHVTHSAVSRQVKALERDLGLRLFEGPRSGLTLTAPGRSLAAGLSLGFDALSEAVRGVQSSSDVHLAIHASLAVKWLIPRLADFERAQPGVRLELTDLPVDAIRVRDADMVVRILAGQALEGQAVHTLSDNLVGLVVAPEFAHRWPDLPRLISASHPSGWTDWTTATGREPPTGPTRTLSHLHYVLDGVTSGIGSAVLPWIMVADAVEAGLLTAPFGMVRDAGQVVAVTMDREPKPAIRRTIAWLGDQAETTHRRAPAPCG